MIPMPLVPAFAPFRSAAVAVALLLAACASAPQQQAPSAAGAATPEQMLAYIREAAGDGEGELEVQPLRDPRVDDLRERAARLQGLGYHRDAAAALDEALALVPGDPALLQERAEAALLQSDLALAGELAERAQALGSGVGPLCRRHWATLEQVRRALDEDAAAESARTAMAGCRVAPPPRW